MKLASASRRAAQPGPLVEKMIPDPSPRGPVVGTADHVNRFRRQLYSEQLLTVGKAIVTPIPEVQGRLHPPARLDEAPDPPVLILCSNFARTPTREAAGQADFTADDPA